MKLPRLAENVYADIRAHCVQSEGQGGGLPRSHWSKTPEIDAALSVLLSEERIVAYQRGSSWTYALPEDLYGSRIPRVNDYLLDALRDTNPDVLMVAEQDGRVLDAVLHYLRAYPPRRLALADGIDALGLTLGRTMSRLDIPRLEIEYSQNGGVRVRAR